MDDNWRMAIGYVCVMFVAIFCILGISWMMSPQEFTFKIEMDNNTKEAFESIEYPIININESQSCHNSIKNSTGEYNWYGCGVPISDERSNNG